MDIWSQTAGRGSPILEFPYRGDFNAWSSYPQQSSFDLSQHSSFYPGIGQNAVVYQVPENIPLETVLRQLGVDVYSLHQAGFDSNHYISGSLPFSFPIFHASRGRRRRLVCYETSDSEDDDYGHRRRHRRHSHHDHPHPQHSQGPSHIHDLLNQQRNLPHSNSTPNMNSLWQSMLKAGQADPQQSAAVNSAWHAMQNAANASQPPPPPPPQPQGGSPAVRNAWNQAQNAPSPSSNFLADMFNKMRQSPGAVIQPPPGAQPNQAAVNNFNVLRNLPPQMDQPAGLPSSLPNQNAVNNFFSARNFPSGPAPGPPNQSVGNVWNRMEGAIQNAPAPPAPSAPSASTLAWNQMQPYASPSYPQPPFGAPQRGPVAAPAPNSFAALLSQAHQRHSPYAGAM